MFDYLEPDPSDNPGADALPLPPKSGSPGPGTRPLTPEKVRHLLYGSLAGIDRTIKILHALGYADPNDWSDPLPVPSNSAGTRSSGSVETWMAIMTKTVLLE